MSFKAGDIIFDVNNVHIIKYAEILKVEGEYCTFKVIKSSDFKLFRPGKTQNFPIENLKNYEVVKNPEVVKVLFG